MKINKDRRIGRVLFVVEGSKTEFNLLRRIFCSIFEYDYIEKRRNKPNFFVSPKDQHSSVAVVNTRESNIKDITDHAEYLDAVFNLLRETYHFPVEKSAIYYLFDRDPESNTDMLLIKEYIKNLNNPYENEVGSSIGQLLLSYPSIEGYMISNFYKQINTTAFRLGSDAKAFIGEHKNIQLNKINEETLLHAMQEFAFFLSREGIEWEIDQFQKASGEMFERQERYYQQGGFKLFSMLTLAFLQLGIIEM